MEAGQETYEQSSGGIKREGRTMAAKVQTQFLAEPTQDLHNKRSDGKIHLI